MEIESARLRDAKNIKQNLADIASKNMADIKKAEAEKKAAQTKKDSFSRSEDKFGSTYIDALIKQIKSVDESSESNSKSIDSVATCMKIARRIMNGDRVPTKDIRFLQENYPDLYKQALLFRKVNPKPKKYKSLVGDDEDENTAVRDGGGVSEVAQSDSAEAEQTVSETAAASEMSAE